MLERNDVARCTITADRELLFDAYGDDPTTGSFLLIDRSSNVTVAAGMIVAAASSWDREPSGDLQAHPSTITADERAARLGQRPVTVLLTGLTGTGKSSLALALERRLFDLGRTCLRLDGEDLRTGLSRDLGFTDAERSEHLRRVAEVAGVANQQGLLVIVAAQAPQAGVRTRMRDLLGADRYLEVHLDAPEPVRRARDPHGLYQAADRGDLAHLPGVNTEYDVPADADLHLDTSARTLGDCVQAVLDQLRQHGALQGDR